MGKSAKMYCSRDKSHKEIDTALRYHGFKTIDVTKSPGFVDIFAYIPNTTEVYLVECKTGKAKLREDQQKLADELPGFCLLFRNAEEVHEYFNKKK